jgi:elongation factor Ts
MAEINAQQVKMLRDATRAPMMDCRKALEECGGDVEKAKDWLRKKAKVKASDMSDRVAAEGRIFSYVHHTKKIGVLLEAGCETDFVAASEDFNTLFQDICLHIAANTNCRFLSREEVPAERVEREKAIFEEEMKNIPAEKREKVLQGKIENFFKGCVLLEQPFIKDDSKSVREAIQEKAGLLQENVTVRRFARYEIGL